MELVSFCLLSPVNVVSKETLFFIRYEIHSPLALVLCLNYYNWCINKEMAELFAVLL
jgi:hypothetical protein